MIINKFLTWWRMPSCAEALEGLQSYLDGEVDEKTARRMASHLDHCTDCDVEAEAYRKIKASLASAAEPVAPEVLASLQAFSARLVTGEIE